MLTYPWKCTVLRCNHLGNTWKPLVLMTRHFDYCPSTSEGDNQSVGSSAPAVSRCFPGGYNVKLYISRGRLAWWLLAFLHSDIYECCVFLYTGPGSTLLFSQELVGTLHTIVNNLKKHLGVQRITMLDVPCGDMVWMHRFLQTRDDIMYTGMDIVPDLIQHHQKEYPISDYPLRKFIHADVVTVKELGHYDIILCRMLMQHLKYFDVYQLLQKISNSGSHVVLMTTINSPGNSELNLGKASDNYRFRPVNLELPPYQLGPPICLQRDGPPKFTANKGWDHSIGLWKLPLKVHASCKATQQNKWKNTTPVLYSCARWKKPL